MPLHFMQAIKIPSGVIKHIDRLRRSFLWKGSDPCKGINCLLNWGRVCALKENGGLGIISLSEQNDALLTKWIWNIESKPEGLWATTILKLYGTTGTHQLRYAEESPFLKVIAGFIHLYNSSVDSSASLRWRWSSSGLFTCASTYKFIHHTGICQADQAFLWAMRIPPKVKIFICLLRQNKILTQQVLISRGCTVQQGCQLCISTDVENTDHIMWSCPYAIRFWQGLFAQHNIFYHGGGNFDSKWDMSLPNILRKEVPTTNIIWAVGAWALRRERNRRFFSNNSKPVHLLINDTTIEIMFWKQPG